jgi:MFS family permease
MSAAFAIEWYFLGVYAIRLGATPLHMGLITSLRALLMVVGSTLANRWRSRYHNPVIALNIPIVAYRVLLYFSVAAVAFLPQEWRVNALVAVVVLSAIPTGIAQGVFLGMMRYAVDARDLARVVARRSTLMNGTILVWVLLLGQFLEHVSFPLNYQIGFLLAFVASMLSWWDIRQVKCPDIVPVVNTETPTVTINVWKYAPFARFAFMVFTINFSVFMAAPIVPLQLVRGLNATDGWISIFGIFEMGAGMLATLRIEWLINRFGKGPLIIATTFATVLHPLILGLTPNYVMYIVGVIFFGMGWFTVNVLLYNRLVEIVPPEDFPHYAAAYQLLINTGLFLGPLVGTFLIENGISLLSALLIIAGLRATAGVLTWIMRPKPITQAVQPAVKAV